MAACGRIRLRPSRKTPALKAAKQLFLENEINREEYLTLKRADRRLKRVDRRESSRVRRMRRVGKDRLGDSGALARSTVLRCATRTPGVGAVTGGSRVVELDPILLEPLELKPFIVKRANGTMGKYNWASLIDWILASGDFCEPASRVPFDDDALRRLDAKARELGKESILLLKKDPSRHDIQRFQATARDTLEQLAGAYVTQMLEIIETVPRPASVDASFDALSNRLLLEIFPSFADLFGQLQEGGYSTARCVEHYKLRVRGPPNRPTQDRSSLRAVVLDFLDTKQGEAERAAQQDGSTTVGVGHEESKGASASHEDNAVASVGLTSEVIV